jgi:hypothetical protein
MPLQRFGARPVLGPHASLDLGDLALVELQQHQRRYRCQ